ncbi:MAG: portal protein, partial [Methanobacterium sp.]
ILTIYSESDRVRGVLEDLFENKLDINTNLQMWARGVCKYGDNFVYLKINPEKGVIGCQQLPNIEIERIEGAATKTPTMGNELKLPPRELKFQWKNKDMEFQSWEIAHFRLLGDDRKLPYGTSMLDKIRRIWKQLLLAEDAMLIYRTSRAPERRVFKIFVGNMDDKDIEPYVQRVANKFKRDVVADARNGQVDMRYNQMAVDQDYFIPVRDPSQSNPIDTLPGAQNLGEIADIEYIQKKLLAALRIPKAFIGFEEVVGEGKSLALMDISFARTINRIQKSLIQELNKIALIHLYLLGFEDDLDNFTLSLTNPSAQSDLLRIEQWKEKITLYKDATSDQSQMGILPVSHTWAKKNILGMSDSEVILDLQQQRIERAMGFELTNTNLIIKRSGVFDEVDEKYGIPEEERKKVEASGAAGAEPGGGMEMGLGGGGGSPTPAPAGGEGGGAPAGGEGPLSESKKQVLTSMFDKTENFEDLFDMNKAQRNIYEITNKLNKIIND